MIAEYREALLILINIKVTNEGQFIRAAKALANLYIRDTFKDLRDLIIQFFENNLFYESSARQAIRLKFINALGRNDDIPMARALYVIPSADKNDAQEIRRFMELVQDKRLTLEQEVKQKLANLYTDFWSNVPAERINSCNRKLFAFAVSENNPLISVVVPEVFQASVKDMLVTRLQSADLSTIRNCLSTIELAKPQMKEEHLVSLAKAALEVWKIPGIQQDIQNKIFSFFIDLELPLEIRRQILTTFFAKLQIDASWIDKLLDVCEKFNVQLMQELHAQLAKNLISLMSEVGQLLRVKIFHLLSKLAIPAELELDVFDKGFDLVKQSHNDVAQRFSALNWPIERKEQLLAAAPELITKGVDIFTSHSAFYQPADREQLVKNLLPYLQASSAPANQLRVAAAICQGMPNSEYSQQAVQVLLTLARDNEEFRLRSWATLASLSLSHDEKQQVVDAYPAIFEKIVQKLDCNINLARFTATDKKRIVDRIVEKIFFYVKADSRLQSAQSALYEVIKKYGNYEQPIINFLLIAQQLYPAKRKQISEAYLAILKQAEREIILKLLPASELVTPPYLADIALKAYLSEVIPDRPTPFAVHSAQLPVSDKPAMQEKYRLLRGSNEVTYLYKQLFTERRAESYEFQLYVARQLMQEIADMMKQPDSADLYTFKFNTYLAQLLYEFMHDALFHADYLAWEVYVENASYFLSLYKQADGEPYSIFLNSNIPVDGFNAVLEASLKAEKWDINTVEMLDIPLRMTTNDAFKEQGFAKLRSIVLTDPKLDNLELKSKAFLTLNHYKEQALTPDFAAIVLSRYAGMEDNLDCIDFIAWSMNCLEQHQEKASHNDAWKKEGQTHVANRYSLHSGQMPTPEATSDFADDSIKVQSAVRHGL